MTMIAKLEKAIEELEAQRQKLLEELQKHGWEDSRLNERIPERRERAFEDILDWDKQVRVIPEKAPLPPNIGRTYQQWYSATQAIIAKNQPDRLPELEKAYSSIKNSLGGRHVTKDDQFRLMDLINAQFDLLAAVPSHLRFSIYDIELEAYSVLMDDEIEAASHLLSKGFLRPAGVLAGVVLERHLKNLLRKHTPPIKFRKNATLSSLNDLCKDSIYDLVTWRKIQHLADLRNLCAHDKTREPTKDEVGELTSGVSAILRT
jgi:hypothetical protein